VKRGERVAHELVGLGVHLARHAADANAELPEQLADGRVQLAEVSLLILETLFMEEALCS
jgi:hypothetical protein